MKLFELENVQLLKKSLDVYTKQHEAIAKNIANANNPEYKPMNTDFSSVLKTRMAESLRTADPRHIGQPKSVESKAGSASGNSEVDVTREMGALAENQIRFEFASKTLARVYRALSMSITGKDY